MPSENKENPKVKSELHPRNKHRNRYDFKALIKANSALKAFVKLNDYGDESIDFFNPEAVKELNRSILFLHYGLQYWDIPEGYLCPPIPGRADYIHHIAELLEASPRPTGYPKIKGADITCLDIGVGANCIYPIIGFKEYGWHFIATDIDREALEAALKNINSNPDLRGSTDLRLQWNPHNALTGMIKEGELVDVVICNPPFHASKAEAFSSNIRKTKNLKGKKVVKPTFNFGGQSNELWCEGGEERFVKDLIFESRQFSETCLWFTTLVSKETNLRTFYRTLKKVGAHEVKTIEMKQGQKTSRILAWTFLNEEDQKLWWT